MFSVLVMQLPAGTSRYQPITTNLGKITWKISYKRPDDNSIYKVTSFDKYPNWHLV